MLLVLVVLLFPGYEGKLEVGAVAACRQLLLEYVQCRSFQCNSHYLYRGSKGKHD